jgi:hypothetical protein
MTSVYSGIGAVALASLALAACSDDAPPQNLNPSRLWLALDGSEIQVKLSPVQPPIF